MLSAKGSSHEEGKACPHSRDGRGHHASYSRPAIVCLCRVVGRNDGGTKPMRVMMSYVYMRDMESPVLLSHNFRLHFPLASVSSRRSLTGLASGDQPQICPQSVAHSVTNLINCQWVLLSCDRHKIIASTDKNLVSGCNPYCGVHV